jgi:hypothetical protein
MKIDRKNIALIISFLLTTTLTWSTATGQTLQAKEAGAKFPTRLGYTTAIYDDEDSVYIFGG